MKQQGSVLLVDDDEDILVAGKLLLKRFFSDVRICNQPEHIPVLLSEHQFDAILLDMNFGPGESTGEQGYNWLDKIIAIDPQAVVIMITAHGGIDTAVEVMKRGATDFIAKPWQNEKVIATVSSAVKLGQSRGEASALRQTNQTLTKLTSKNSQPFIASASAMQPVMNIVERCAPTDANVLILGENGTGKEVIARAIHDRSTRSDNVFITVDLGAVPESLFESELFGHKKGAFTGAMDDRVGRILAANGGTLFLDEIGNLPMHLQAKLLAVLAQREVTPVGANKATPFNVRILAATNMPIDQLRDERRFRQDLLFRLNTVELTLPALRQRQEDIIPIATMYLADYARKYVKDGIRLSAALQDAFLAYSWPGNIRELKHAIERAVILCNGDELRVEDFQLSHAVTSVTSQMPALQSEHAVQDIACTHSTAPPELTQPTSAAGEQFNLEEIEKQTIAKALKAYRYNISHAAKALGLTRAALYRRMEKHGL